MSKRIVGKGELVWRLLAVVAVVVALMGTALVLQSGSARAQANPSRDLPGAPVKAGESFDVVVTFTAPQDGFRNIGLVDTVPAGWAIQANTAWCTPIADGMQTSGGQAQYMWFWNEYDAGTNFAVVYRVTVPVGAGVASYAFDGQLGYKIYGGDRIFEDIGGDSLMHGLGISSTDGGEVTTPEEGVFVCTAGSVVNLVAVADACYEFVEWTGDTGTIDDPGAAQTTITMSGDYEIQANFERSRYALTVNWNPVEGGTATGSGTYDCCTSPTVEATPNECWRFVDWTGDVGNATSPETTVHIDGNKTVTANFARITYELTTASTGGGTVTAPGAPGPFTRDCGDVVGLVAVADECYEFVNWTGDVQTVGNVTAGNTTITMLGDYEIQANFQRLPDYVLSISSTAGGNVTVPGEGNFTRCEGLVVPLVADADACYEFVNWTGDVQTVGDVNSAQTTVTMLGDYEIQANFAKISYQLTTGSTEGGSVTVPGEPGPFTRDCGDVVDLVAVADEGYGFVNWTGDVGTVADVDDPTTTITMLGDYEIQANFEQGTPVVGVTREVNCAILPGVSVKLYQGDVEVGSTVSGGNGSYQLIAPAIGEYTVVASKAGEYRDETRTIQVTGLGPAYTVVCDFARQYGLIPNAPDMWYALDCVDLWQYPPSAECELDMWTALDVVDAWQYPIP